MEHNQIELFEEHKGSYAVLTKDINVIRNHFNALNMNLEHFNNSNDICTPIGCVEEMVNSIPNEFWGRKDIKVFDSCCGNGNFHAYIYTKTKLKNLYFNEINEKRIANVKEYFGENINITNEDFLNYDETEQFDLVVSNPPYAKFTDGKRASKNHNMARDFIKKALKITKKEGYLLFIVPNNWMSFSDRNTLPKELTQYQFIHIDIHGSKKWFPKVGSSFTWFLLKKTENKNSFTVANNYFIKDLQEVSLKPNSSFIPLYLSNTVNSILDKVVYSNGEKYNIETTSYLHHYTKRDVISNTKSKTYKYRLIHTPTQTAWSKQPHKYQDGYKVFISLTNQYSTFIDDCGMTQSVAFVRCKSLPEAKKIKEELDNPLYKFIINITRYGNFNNIRILQNLSLLKDIKLTKEELKLIEKFNSIYYHGKKEK